MLDRDIYTGNPSDIDKAKVVMTMVDGKMVFQSK